MHNCKLTRGSFVDLALDEIPSARATQLLSELNECEACQAEYAALRSTLHVSNQALRSVLPAEEFWPGYHSRLQSKLLISETEQVETGEHFASVPMSASSQLWLTLRSMATTSLRVPLPVALGLMLLFGMSFFVLRSRGQINATPPAPAALVETKTVEVPVIQEKVVTRVVYVARNRSRGVAKRSDRKEAPTPAIGSDPAPTTAMSLAGFKPTEEVNLTVIKGSYKDEKR